MNWRQRIERLVAQGGPKMVFQPILRLEDEQVLGFEALARFPEKVSDSDMEILHGPDWRFYGYEGFGPAVWFHQADLLDLGVELELAAIESALRHVEELPDGTYMAVNCGPTTLASGLLQERVHGVDLSRVVVELTEHLKIADYGNIRQAVLDLQAEHSRTADERIPSVAADDVGAGSASLMHLLELQDVLDFAKLDVGLTRGVDHDLARQALARAMVKMGELSGYHVVAEGVEHRGQLKALRGLGVYAGQGWLLGKPGPLK